jgi:hypothetical protein
MRLHQTANLPCLYCFLVVLMLLITLGEVSTANSLNDDRNWGTFRRKRMHVALGENFLIWRATWQISTARKSYAYFDSSNMLLWTHLILSLYWSSCITQVRQLDNKWILRVSRVKRETRKKKYFCVTFCCTDHAWEISRGHNPNKDYHDGTCHKMFV